MDADDIARPERLRLQLAHATETGATVVGCRVAVFPEELVTGGMRHYIEWVNGLTTHEAIAHGMFVESPMVHPSAMVARDALRGVGGWREGMFPEDYDLWLRLFEAGHRFAKVDEVLLEWRDSEARLTRTDPRYSVTAFRALKAEVLARTVLRCGEAQIWGAGPDGRAWYRALAERGISVLRYFDVDPKKIGRAVHGAAPILPWESVGDYRGVPLLVAVGVKGVRERIRRALAQVGYREGVDHICVQ
jgi:hypothetical protein